ncbi:MAG: DNA polymerase III subunit alpha [Elusimicrobia bacterium]|nr:DNA polymerase III subunit alpha [Elusimicrobiota bacterium]
MNSKPEFVHLHNHSEYSLLDGIIRFTDNDGGPSELIKSLAKERVKGFAVTDHGNMFGAMECFKRCRAEGLKPIVGIEFYIVKGSRFDRGHSQRENCHLVALAKNFEGYQNLMYLSSKAYTEGFYYDPRIDKDLLARHAKGLVLMSACIKGEVNQAILNGDMAGAEKLAAAYRDLAEPGCFFLELMDHGLEEERRANEGLMELHRRTGIPLVATNDCHYPRKADEAAHDAALCISTRSLLADTDRLRFCGPEFYVKSPDEMAKLFGAAPQALSNTLAIAEMCALDIPMGRFILPEFAAPEGLTQDTYLEKLAHEGLKRRLPGGVPAAHEERLRYELGVIRKNGFSGYFLVVWDFIAYAKRSGIPVGPGRGSGAGSLVAYSLGITNLDPLEHKLLFERFLNPDRVSMPDLDIDFADIGRDRVIEYVRKRYGAENVAQIITFGSLGAKLAVKDVGRVMGVPLPEVERLAKMIPTGPDVSLKGAMAQNPELAKAAQDPQTRKLLDLALKLEGLKRHTGVHAAGTVITKEPVLRYSPLAKGRNDVVTTQYDGDTLPALGLLKVDFLGLRTLTIIQNAVEFIRARRDPAFDIEKIPMDDPKTYELLRKGESLAVFQLDSSGMRSLLQQLKPSVFNDIVAILALYRPGPMKAHMDTLFVERKHGREKTSYEHPLLESILQDTYGCIVFQEQVMEISKKLAGFTGGQADGLRKAMGKKNPEEFQKMRPVFVEGAAKKGVPGKLANKIYDQLLEFGGYGFNRSHTAAYGLVAYQTAYLKTTFPLEFMCAVATSEIGHSAVGSDDKENKLVIYLEDARRMGLKVLPPDVQRSGTAFTISDPDGIRFGLVAVKNVGAGAAEAIVAAREAGPFKSLQDFCARVDLKAANKKAIESLARAGALDCLEPGAPPAAVRARLLAALDETVERQAKLREDLSRGQGSLFGPDALGTAVDGRLPADVPPLSENDVLRFEKEVLGFYFSGHPLLEVKALLQAVRTHEICALNPQISTPVRLAGILTQVKRKVTKDGKQMAEAVLEDLTGTLRILVFPRAYAGEPSRKPGMPPKPALGPRLVPGAIVVAAGKLSFSRSGSDETEGGPELFLDGLDPLAEALPRYAEKLVMTCPPGRLDERTLETLRETLERHRGRCPVVLEHETPAGTSVLEVEQRVMIDQNLLKSLDSLLGAKSWRIESAS